jgi:hypothetical protein
MLVAVPQINADLRRSAFICRHTSLPSYGGASFGRRPGPGRDAGVCDSNRPGLDFCDPSPDGGDDAGSHCLSSLRYASGRGHPSARHGRHGS